MAYDKTPVIPASAQNRTWRANIETPVAGGNSIQVFREDVSRDADGVVTDLVQSMLPVSRTAAAIASESVTVSIGGEDVEVTAAMIMAALPKFFDRWTQEDVTAGKRPA